MPRFLSPFSCCAVLLFSCPRAVLALKTCKKYINISIRLHFLNTLLDRRQSPKVEKKKKKRKKKKERKKDEVLCMYTCLEKKVKFSYTIRLLFIGKVIWIGKDEMRNRSSEQKFIFWSILRLQLCQRLYIIGTIIWTSIHIRICGNSIWLKLKYVGAIKWWIVRCSSSMFIYSTSYFSSFTSTLIGICCFSASDTRAVCYVLKVYNIICI